jgi:23S rRNA pseudouridine1911/1915/1917 synthase
VPVTGDTFTVAAGEDGLRLDAFLVRRGLFPSATAARRWLAADQGRVRVQGQPARKGARVLREQVVEVLARPEGLALVAEPGGALEVLHQDEALVVVAKPAGVPTHPLRPGETGSLAAALIARFPECASASRDPREGGFVHRLDVGTSGLLVAARTPAAFRALRESMRGDSEKHYLAEVVGHPGAVGDSLVVDQPIGRPGRRAARVVLGTGRGLLPARTDVIVRERRAASSVVEARLHAGRPHQVRVHLAHLGCPIVGDVVYGAAAEQGGFHLHAWRLWVRHPLTGARLFLEAAPPVWARIQ